MKITGAGASNRSDIAPFHAMEVMAAATAAEAAGRSIIHMEVGQPRAAAPKAARAALTRALDTALGYTVALGRDDLRRAIAARYGRVYGVELDPARVIVTTGSSGGFQLSFLTLFDAGDRLAIADPSYPSYRNLARALGIEVARLETGPATAFQPDRAALDAAGPVNGLMVASPNNPTGTILDRTPMQDLAEACAAQGAWLMSDEIYHGLHYGARAVSALEVTDDAVVLNSFSKYFCMTGWRIGWMVAPERLVRPIERLQQNLFVCPPHASQVAALAALEAEEELEAIRRDYADARAILLDALPKLGFGAIAPCDGAFYVYADVTPLTADRRFHAAGATPSQVWCQALLQEAGVATTPGVDFDPVDGGAWARFSFAGGAAVAEEGVARLKRWLGG